MQIEVEHRGNETHFTLVGRLDAEAGPGVYLRFQRELFRGRTEFVFHLDRVELVDSSGLGVLVRCYKESRARGGSLTLQNVPDAIGRILQFTRLDTIFSILDEAADPANDRRAA